MKMETEKIKAFLDDLSKLSRKHRIVVRGCGCCGSPFLMDITPDEPVNYSVDGEFELDHNWTMCDPAWAPTTAEDIAEYKRRFGANPPHIEEEDEDE